MANRLVFLRCLTALGFVAVMPSLAWAECDPWEFNKQILDHLKDATSTVRDDLRRRAIACELQNARPAFWSIANLYELMGGDAEKSGRPGQADEYYELASEYWEREARRFPGSPLPVDAGRVLRKRALRAIAGGNVPAALDMLSAAAKIVAGDIVPNPWEALEVANELAKIFVSKGRAAEAAGALSDALKLAEASRDISDGDHTGIFYRSYLRQAELLNSLSDYAAAESTFKKAVRAAHRTDVFIWNIFSTSRELKTLDEITASKDPSEILAQVVTMGAEGAQSREAQVRIAFARFLLKRDRAAEAEAQLFLVVTAPQRVGAQAFIVAAEALVEPSSTSEALLLMNVVLGEKVAPLQQLRLDLQRTELLFRERQHDLLEAIKKTETSRDRKVEGVISSDLEALQGKRQRLRDELIRGVNPNALPLNGTPLSAHEAQDLLRVGEAILMYFVNEGRTIGWLVQPGRDVVMRPLSFSQVEAAFVAIELRRTLDGRPGVPTGAIPFNTDLAALAYEKLVAPFSEALAKTSHLFVVTNGPLQSVPFGIFLQTRSNLASGIQPEYGRLDWLGKRFAISVLPSVDALRVVRNHPPSLARKRFAAIGDPLLEATAASEQTSRPVLLGTIGGVADRGVLSKAAPQLDLTATIDNMVDSLGLKRDWPEIYTRDKATESRVRELPLNDYSVIAFVTHGLTATSAMGHEPVLAEPALVLTPPPTQGTDPEADGLLTASEIARLQMINTDLVLLVACNSAAAGEPLTLEAFSGLPRAFFLAGARAVIASHWFANHQAADRFFSIMLHHLRVHPDSTLAEAQKAAINWLLSRKGVWSHPHFWAPFVMIGDGGARLPGAKTAN
jgi:CHAT domain-containing protein